VPVPRQEKTLHDRIRNAASSIPAGPDLLTASTVTLTAWNMDSLGSIQVDGNSPNRRDLNLLVAPLQVHLHSGSFTLRTGTVPAEVIDDTPSALIQGCCPFPLGYHPIVYGPGGSAIFGWTLPADGRRVHMQSLRVTVNAGGADGSRIGSVYDWAAKRWTNINLTYGRADLSHASRFVSPTGQVLLKLRSTEFSGDVRIQDPARSLQISGKGVVAA
jgi:hypothetical protein